MYFLKILKGWLLKRLIFNKMKKKNKIKKKNKMKNLLFDTGMERTGKVELLSFNREIAWEAPGKLYLVFAFSFSSWLFSHFMQPSGDHCREWRVAVCAMDLGCAGACEVGSQHCAMKEKEE